MARAEIIEKSLQDRGALIYCEDQAQALGFANRIAAEHLELAVADPNAWVGGLRHAGAIFSRSLHGRPSATIWLFPTFCPRSARPASHRH